MDATRAGTNALVQGSSPWKLEVQIAGPKGSKTIPFPGLKDSRTKLSIPIPDDINIDGGAFQIDLGAFRTIIRR